MNPLFDFGRSVTKTTNQPILVKRQNNLILTLGKNKYGGVYLQKYDCESRISEFVDLDDYYLTRPEKSRKYSHSLSSALCAIDSLTNPEHNTENCYRLINSCKDTVTLNSYLSKK